MSAPRFPTSPAPATPPAPPSEPSRVPSGQAGWEPRTLLGLVHAELRKALSTWAWWSLLLAAAALCLLVTFVPAKVSGLAFTPSMAQALALGTFGSKFALLFGVVTATAETRHRTLASSYLTAPGRPQLLVAKVALGVLAGLGYGVVCVLFGLLGMLLGGGGPVLGDELGGVVEVSLAGLVVFALWVVLGVGVGTLLHNQLTAVLVTLVYLLLIEQILVAVVGLTSSGHIEPYTPGGSAFAALSGLAAASPFGGSMSGDSSVPWWLGMIVFAGYAAVAVLGGAALAQRRDIT